jgi:plasmid stability protein
MATLNVENLPDDLYERLRARAQREHRSISQQVVHLLSEALGDRRSRSILDLDGLGREVWQDVDATEYVRSERDAWD